MQLILTRHRIFLLLLAGAALAPFSAANAQNARPSLVITSEPEVAPALSATPIMPVAPIAEAPVPRAPMPDAPLEPVIPILNESRAVSLPPAAALDETTPPPAAVAPAAAAISAYPRPASMATAVPEDSAYPQAPIPQLTLPGTDTEVPTGRPLVKIRFDQKNVQYDKTVYDAVSAALKKYPDARFYLYSVFPGGGNVAQLTIESARARRNAESILRGLEQKGVDAGRFDLKTVQRADAPGNEVTILIR